MEGRERTAPVANPDEQAEATDSGCGCCQSTSATSDTDAVGELEARRAAVEQRLRRVAGRVTGSSEEVGP